MSDHSHNDQEIQLPAGTPWPMVTALGICLAFASVVTHWFLAVIGIIITSRAAVGWFKDVYPHEKHEGSPIIPPSAHEPDPMPRTVAHLHMGEDGHRVHIPTKAHPYNSGFWGGMAGGIVMAILAVGWGLMVKKSIWFPINILSASVLPSMSSASETTLLAFDLTSFILAIIIHITLSILVGLLYAAALPMFPKKTWLWAGILSPLFWTALFYATARTMNPMAEKYVNWPWFIVCQIAFGLVCGFLVGRSQQIETLQSVPMAVRAGVEAMRRRK